MAGRIDGSDVANDSATSGKRRPVPPPPSLSAEDRAFVLETIPRAVARALARRDTSAEPPPPAGATEADAAPPAGVTTPAGVFVSIYIGDRLRGCIGQVRPVKPLWWAAADMAIAAATRDPRFRPLEPSDLAGLRYEVSVLGPLVDVPPEERDAGGDFVSVGDHGIQLRRDERSGLLLPQVGERLGIGAVGFLEETARKAGLEPDAWRDPATELSLFRAVCFGGGG